MNGVRSQELISKRAPRSVAFCVLLAKPKSRAASVSPKYVGFGDIPELFVVGYGIDSGSRFRNLPDVAAVDAVGELVGRGTSTRK
jgi:hypoxanthine phosphoribosyltransferase